MGPGGPAFQLNEEQGAQSHFIDFIDLCELLAAPKPGSEAGELFENTPSSAVASKKCIQPLWLLC